MKFMNCKKTHKLLSRYYDGELDAQRSDQVRRHLDFCAQCCSELENLCSFTAMTDEIRQMKIPTDYQRNAINHLAAIIADKNQQQFDKHEWSWHKVFSPFALRISHLTSWAVAGVIIALLFVGMLLTIMPKDGAYAEIKQALDKARATKYIHAIGKLGESWMESGKFSISKRKIGDDDDITMYDYEAGKSYRYYKRLNKVFVYDNPIPSARLTSEYLFKEFKAFIEKSDNWSKTVGEFKGQKVDLYQATRTIEHEANPMRLQCWVDPVSQRILRVEWTVEGSEDEELNYNWREFDYPDDIPKTLFEVGVPKDAEFVNFQNSPEATQLLKTYSQSRQKWDNYRLVVFGKPYGGKTLSVAYHSGKKHRWEMYDLPFGLKDVPTLQDAEQIMKEYYPRLISVEHGGNIIQYEQIRNELTAFYGGGWDHFRDFAFRNFTTSMGSPRTLTEVIGEEEQDGEHLIKVLQHKVEIYLTEGGKNVQEVVFMSTAFWLNPDKDYLIHRAEGKKYYPDVKTGKITESPWETQIEQYAQTKDGIWYPAVVVARDQWNSDNPMVERRFTVLAFETGLKLPDSLFPDEKSFKKLLPPNDGRKLIQQR